MNEMVEKILKKSGWSEERRVDIKDILLKYDEENYQYNNLQKEFLQNFSGLKIYYMHFYYKHTLCMLKIDPIHAVRSVFRSVPEKYEKACQKKMIIVGEALDEPIDIYMSEDGQFYGGYDEYFTKLGDNFEEALYNILNGKRIDEIMVDDDGQVVKRYEPRR